VFEAEGIDNHKETVKPMRFDQGIVKSLGVCSMALFAMLILAPLVWAGYPDTSYESPEDCGNDKSLSDPINLATGDFQYRHEDLRIPGVGFDFVLTRTYRSRSGIWSLWAGHDEVFP